MESGDYFVDKLTLDHAGFIGSHYKAISDDPAVIEKYFQHILIMYDTSAGVFKRSNPSYPVAWGLYGDIGTAIHLCSLPDHKRKGNAGLVTRFLFTQLIQQSLIPVVDRSTDSELSDKSLAKHMMEYAIDRVWRDSATGKRCWLLHV